MDTTTLPDDSAVATDTPPTWSELTAHRLADVLDTIDGDGRTSVADAVDETGGTDSSTTERGGRPRSGPPNLDHRWVLVAPPAGAVVLRAVSSLVEPNPLRTGTSPSGLLAFAVLIPFFLVCVAGTLALIRDAVLIRAEGLDWSPNPWHYVVPSAVALTALRAYPAIRRAGGIEEDLVGLLVGSLVVALAASSILAGPTYLFRRRRRLGSD